MSGQHTPEPFGYFKAEPFGWTDCTETDDDAIPLYDKAAIRLIQKQRDELMLYKNLADEYGLSVFADLAELQKQRDELLSLVIRYRNETPVSHQPHMIAHVADAAIASVKGGAA